MSISGRADVGIEVGNSGYGSKTRVQSGQSTGNRLTFKGDEKLGNDLSAFFILEAGYLLDNGQASSNGSLQQGGTPTAAGAGVNSGTNVASTGAGSYLFQRVSVLGLKSSFGTVQIGRMDSPA
ncbi:MAG TPA: porin, partial [Rhodocyclaceae bacterium]|nr:porin [Rhodocyclaceae bacterium]